MLRVLICLWLLKELAVNWTYSDILYGADGFIEHKPNFLDKLPAGFSGIQRHYKVFISLYGTCILCYMMGIGRWFTALLVFLMYQALLKMNPFYSNGGNMMAKLLLFFLIFADSYKYLVVIKDRTLNQETKKWGNMISNLAALSIMLQLCMTYLAYGITKLIDPLWISGQGVYYALSMERFMATSLSKYLVQNKWMVVALNYWVIGLEVLFPLLVWFKKLRRPLLAMGLLLHAGIFVLLMIYDFQFIMLLYYGLFLPNDKLRTIASRMKSRFKKVVSRY